MCNCKSRIKLPLPFRKHFYLKEIGWMGWLLTFLLYPIHHLHFWVSKIRLCWSPKYVVYSDSSDNTILADPIHNLCSETTSLNLTIERPYSITTLVLMFVLQFGIAAGNIVFFTLAISYLDDNVLAHNSPALIGMFNSRNNFSCP